MTKAKKWPEEADWARQDGISAIDYAVRELEDFLDEDIPAPTIRRIGKLIKRLTTAKLELVTCRSTQQIKEE